MRFTAFRCPVDLIPRLKLKAKSERRTVSNYIVNLIANDTADISLPAKGAPQSKRKAGSRD